jgi:hypothetical protein
MGNTRWSPTDWKSYSSTTKTKTKDELFSSVDLKAHLDPKAINYRESRDSVSNPNSTAIILAFDVTGSMGQISDFFVREGLGNVMREVFTRKSVPDPHILTMAIGDSECDKVPLQVSQFEADLKIASQLTDFFLEGNGGGNDHESYTFAWYFAALHTQLDCFEKRQKKGYLFTIGDEELNPTLYAEKIKQFTSDKPQSDLSANDLFAMVSKRFNVYHVIIEQGNYASRYLKNVQKSWSSVLGQSVLSLSDYTKLSELIISAIEINEGREKESVLNSWDGSTSVTIRNAVKDLTHKSQATPGIVIFK